VPKKRTASHNHALVAICSRNPAKTLGVRKVFLSFVHGPRFVEVDASTVARRQPIGLAEVLNGASKRARFALSEAGADFGVGVEAGLVPIARHKYINLQIAFIVDRHGDSGVGLSAGFLIPEHLVRRMKKERRELDRYSHELTRAEKISEEEGIVYHLTRGRISRLQMTEQSVSMALVPWLSSETYG